MLDVRRLRVLREVARRGSFSAAAEALGYTQPAISRQIATLEAETGAMLVLRRPHGIHLTDVGHVLLGHTDAILARLDEAEAEVHAVTGLRAGRLRIAAFATAAATVVPLAIAAFRQEHAAVDLHVQMMEPMEALPALKAGELDLALSNESDHEPGDGLDYVRLFDDPMYVALPGGHPLAHRRSLTLRDFAGEPWMLGTTRACPDSRLFKRACHAADFEPHIAFENDDYTAILGFVAAGVGVALIPDLAARGVRDDVVIRSLGPCAPIRQVHAVLPGGYRTPAAQAMLHILQDGCVDWVSGRGTLSPV